MIVIAYNELIGLLVPFAHLVLDTNCKNFIDLCLVNIALKRYELILEQ